MFTIEDESGTCAGLPRWHNGYHAGDFTRSPMCTAGELAALAKLWLPTLPVGTGNAG